MKKILCILCASAIVLAMAGCGDNKTADTTTTESMAAPVETTTAEEATDAPEAETTPTADETTAAASNNADIPADIAGAIMPEATSEDSPAPLGQWVKTTIYSATDKTYHTVYVHVTKVVTDTEDTAYVQAAIDLNNSFCADYNKIDRAEIELPSDVELCVLEYEVYVPSDFPSQEWGIIAPDIDFSQGKIGGGGIPSADGTSVYIGLGSNTTDLETEDDPKYAPGNTYKFVNLFTMVKGFEDYSLSTSSYFDGTEEISADNRFSVFFAHK